MHPLNHSMHEITDTESKNQDSNLYPTPRME